MNKLLLLFFFSLPSICCYGDSPLTATMFHTAYSDVPEVQLAVKAHGNLTPELLVFLADTARPLDYKLAVINALGWDQVNRQNGDMFKDYILEQRFFFKKKYDKTEKAIVYAAFIDGRADDLLCYAYMKAMENYDNPSPWHRYVFYANRKAPENYCVKIIGALIRAQVLIDIDLACAAFDEIRKTKTCARLKNDMRLDASNEIYNYFYENRTNKCD